MGAVAGGARLALYSKPSPTCSSSFPVTCVPAVRSWGGAIALGMPDALPPFVPRPATPRPPLSAAPFPGRPLAPALPFFAAVSADVLAAALAS